MAIAICVVASAAIWLVTRRYAGIHNDAALYALMALARADPATFGSDLFVRFGSQDPFSLFSPLYGTAIAALGLQNANIALTLVAHALWLTGAWMLTARLLRGLPARAALVLIAAIPAYYGGWAVLFAGEAILTPRPFAEAMTMIALAWLLKGRWRLSAMALGLAALLHPAMALAGLTAAWLILGLRRRWVLWAAPVGAAGTLVLAAAGVQPFARLFQVMDGRWLALVMAHNGFLFTGAWMAADRVRVISEFAICAAAAAWSGGHRRRALIAVAVTAAAGLVVSMVGADLARDVLVIQLQTWRLTWLLAVVALPAVVLLAQRLRRRRLGWAACALLAAPLIILTRPFSDKALAWGAALAMSLAGLTLAVLIRRGRAPALSRTAERMIIEAAVILPLGALGDSAINLAQDIAFRLRHGTFSLDPAMFIFVRAALLAAGAGLVLLARRRPAVALATASLGLILAAAVWDARTPWDRTLIAGGGSSLTLPAGATILWADEAPPTWFLLRRPAYVSSTQAAGLVFSPATASEWRRRADIVAPLVTLEDWSLKSGSPDCRARFAPVSPEAIASVCARAAGLTGIVTDRPVTGGEGIPFTTGTPQPIACNTRRRLDVRRVARFTYASCAPRPGGRLGPH
ncbi:MAG TPA: hypothetical protein VGI30_07325 [Caulobacteraceae bacterium]|jgi:hypothetical protein